MVGEIHLCSQPKRVTGLPRLSTPESDSGRTTGRGQWAHLSAGLSGSIKRTRGGEDKASVAKMPPWSWRPKPLRGSPQSTTSVVSVCTIWPPGPTVLEASDTAGAGGHGTQDTVPGVTSCQSPPTLGGTAWSQRGRVSGRPAPPRGGAKSRPILNFGVVGSTWQSCGQDPGRQLLECHVIKQAPRVRDMTSCDVV